MAFRRGDLNNTLASMSGALSEVSRNVASFGSLHDMLSMIPEIRKAETCNRNMVELMKNIPQVIPNLRNGSLNRNGQSFSNVFNRMLNNLQCELTKVHEEVDNIERGFQNLQATKQEQLQTESLQFIKDIELTLAENTTKMMTMIHKKEQQYLQQKQKNTYCITRLTNQLATCGISTDLQECKEIMGQIWCLSSQNQQKKSISKSQIQEKCKFMHNCQLHFNREVNFVAENIEKLQSVNANKDSVYEQRLLQHFCSWAHKLIVCLQSAILKATSLEKLSEQNQENEFQAKSSKACHEWYSMIHRLSTLLQK